MRREKNFPRPNGIVAARSCKTAIKTNIKELNLKINRIHQNVFFAMVLKDLEFSITIYNL